MASTIQIKRGTGSAVPSGLADGELAINLDTGRLYFGSGSASPGGSTSINNFTFTNLTAENYTVSSSVTHLITQTLSGSTRFGDTQDDTHQLTGSLNITGSITSSGDLVIKNITSSGTISSSGTILGGPIIARDYVEFGTTLGTRIDSPASNQIDINIGSGGSAVSKLNVYSTLVRTTTPLQVGIDSGDYLKVLGNITASGDISASNAVLTGNITASGDISASSAVLRGNLDVKGNVIIGDGDDSLYVGGNVSASGEVQTSKFRSHETLGVIELEGASGAGLKIHTTHGTGNRVVGLEMSASGDGQVFSMALDRTNDSLVIAPSVVANSNANAVFELSATGHITASGNISASSAVLTGNITASGDISASGDIFATSYGVGGQGLAIFHNSTLRHGYDSSLVKYSYGKDSDNEHLFYGDITASANISASGTVLTGNITASGDISASSAIFTGTVTSEEIVVGNDIQLSNNSKIFVGSSGTQIIANNDDYWTISGNGIEGIRVASNGVRINEGGAASCDFRVEGDSDTHLFFTDAGADKVAIGTDTVSDSLLTVDGDITATNITASGDISASSAIFTGTVTSTKNKFAVTGDTDGTHQGDVVFFGGTTSMTAGAIYYYKPTGAWILADADQEASAKYLLGVALGSASDTDGVLLRGMVTLNHDPGALADVLYLSTTAGEATATAPSGNGDIVRIIGYCLNATNGQIWFNPDSTFVEVNA